MKKNKPAQDLVMTEPELGTAAPDTSTPQPPPEPVYDIPAPTSDLPTEETLGSSDEPETPSPAKTQRTRFN